MLRRIASEFIATYGLVFAGTGAIVIDTVSGGVIGHLGVGLVFGLIVAAMIYSTGHISGAHMNPAVTVAFALARHFPWRDVPVYWAAQLAGACGASLTLYLLFGLVGDMGATLPSGSQGQSLGLEIVLSFFLMFVIMAVATDVRAVGQGAALAIGATVALEAIFAGPISGASMNPARSIGPAVVSGNFTALWVYCVGPVFGMALAAGCYWLLREDGPRGQDAASERVEAAAERGVA
ncbi:MAG: aquaporin [Dehalococcoidia bacterium]